MYKLTAYQPSYQCNANKLRLFNVTDSHAIATSVVGYSTSSTNGSITTVFQDTFTITKTTRLKLEYWATDAGYLGIGASWIASGAGDNIYSQVTIEKLK